METQALQVIIQQYAQAYNQSKAQVFDQCQRDLKTV